MRSQDSDELLAHMMRLAKDRGGWCVDGVWGWRFREEISLEASQVARSLEELIHDGSVRIGHVRQCGVQRPRRIFRISERGARTLSKEHPTALFTREATTQDAARATFLHMNQWLMLHALVRRADTGLGPHLFGEPGWMTGRDLRRAIGEPVVTNDLLALEAEGLVVKRRTEATAGPGRWAYCGTSRFLAAIAWTVPVPRYGPVAVAARLSEHQE